MSDDQKRRDAVKEAINFIESAGINLCIASVNLRAAVRQAVAEEREACAKVADTEESRTWTAERDACAVRIAASIRARAAKEPKP